MYQNKSSFIKVCFYRQLTDLRSEFAASGLVRLSFWSRSLGSTLNAEIWCRRKGEALGSKLARKVLVPPGGL